LFTLLASEFTVELIFLDSHSTYNTMKNIGILGSGAVAKMLGKGFIDHGYQVMLGTRDSSKLEDWRKELGEKSKIGDFDETADFGDILVLAIKGSVANELVIKLKDKLKGKTIIDATNPIEDSPPENGVLNFFTNLKSSLMEQLQNSAPDAHFVKAFNSVGSAHMVNPAFETKPTMFICGNDDSAKFEVKNILYLFGWETEDVGGVEAARAIEPLCMLWCIPGFLRGEWSHAFKLLKK
jgi:hypothetical protein